MEVKTNLFIRFKQWETVLMFPLGVYDQKKVGILLKHKVKENDYL